MKKFRVNPNNLQVNIARGLAVQSIPVATIYLKACFWSGLDEHGPDNELLQSIGCYFTPRDTNQ